MSKSFPRVKKFKKVLFLCLPPIQEKGDIPLGDIICSNEWDENPNCLTVFLTPSSSEDEIKKELEMIRNEEVGLVCVFGERLTRTALELMKRIALQFATSFLKLVE